jgi:AGCS family alanine or glycine:cation symporter
MVTLVDFITWANDKVNKFVWGVPMLLFFLFVGLLFTIRLRFYQLTGFKEWISNTILACFKRKDVLKTSEKKSISQWQALTTALASTSGTGNIAGVATAITAGGPGAIFWMWVSAFLGMMTHYAEVVLGMHYRHKDNNGNWVGGPMIYMEKGLNSKLLASIFSFFCILATLGIGNMSQSNSMADAISFSFGVPKIIIGVITAVIVALVIMGGVKRIASVSEKIVPFMSVLYLIGALVVIFNHLPQVPQAFSSIFQEAFNLRAAGGGVIGYGISIAMKKGISRGVFSNEAGLGSSVLVHSVSDAKEPVVQGMWGIFEVFADTLVVCTITAITILCSGVYQSSTYLSALHLDKLNGTTLFFDALPNGVTLTSSAFATTFGAWGHYFVTFSIILFAVATLIGWSYYGECGCKYLFGADSIFYYKILYIFIIVIGAVARLEFVWSISDTFNGLMAIPNLIAITLLSGKVISISRDYFKRKGGKLP